MPDADVRQQVMTAALGWAGTPYRHQASIRQVGCDCLGLVRGIWREVYGCEPEPVPAYTAHWAEAGRQEQLIEAACRHMTPVEPVMVQPGDLLAFRWRAHLPAKHLGIAMPQGRMIHAQDGIRVCEVALNGWWRRHLAAAFAFPQLPD